MQLSCWAFLVAMSAGCGASASSSTGDLFVGDWKLNPARSTITDVMKVESVDGNKYVFDFGGGGETIVADGTDQPGNMDTTLAVTIAAPDEWKIVRKKAGSVWIHAQWKLSPDGRTLSDDYTELGDNGQVVTHATYVYRRTGDARGFAGVWEGTIALPSSQSATLQVRPYDKDGLSFTYPAAHVIRDVKLDGKDYAIRGEGAAKGSTASAHWVGKRTVEVTDKVDGKITRTQQIEVSDDKRSVTQTARAPGQTGPTILVFERQ